MTRVEVYSTMSIEGLDEENDRRIYEERAMRRADQVQMLPSLAVTVTRPGDRCDVCGRVLKALFTGTFCPAGCDKPEEVARRKAEYEALMERVARFNLALGDENEKTWPGSKP